MAQMTDITSDAWEQLALCGWVTALSVSSSPVAHPKSDNTGSAPLNVRETPNELEPSPARWTQLALPRIGVELTQRG